MKTNRNTASLGDHKLNKKKGTIITPLNDALGEKLQLSSWSRERIPEYLWLGLILLKYDRKDALDKASSVLFEISKNVKSLVYPKLSKILSLSFDDQLIVYEIINKLVGQDFLSPLTLLYKYENYPLFNDYFFIQKNIGVNKKIDILSKAIRALSFHQSDLATDLRYLVLRFMIFNEKLVISDEVETAKALEKYPFTDHTDELMRSYRPIIRSMEGVSAGLEELDTNFVNNFWRNLGMITECNPITFSFAENLEDFNLMKEKWKKILNYITLTNKEKTLSNDKFDVLVGSVNYALKIFIEIDENKLGNRILGRHAIRTIIEVYIMLKYLLKKEVENPKIWIEYKLYGISKYKLILLKARESGVEEGSHFLPPFVESIVNEIRSEEFIDIDLKYFDKQGIREKSKEVGEKYLYDLLYDYDSSFSHGLWGAIRESSMLHCDNPAHLFHAVPDVYLSQDLTDVKSDSVIILNKLFEIISEIYEFPES
ncbi:hypothetical protein LPTSP2_38800 [Leptospira ellinghausenii]|uniref:Uncharacterized protein n=1 Tax=Leptospira ellinghausenii TaxID=1917822 RepID=A0A2P2DIU0_9LEPT|nr:DUF5677 domain-containing protein [Leptospira ellinghausenii]GBF44577.1 hypothetical protein LPTSP2_38800 [Leptospira ellinghausenii]